MPARDALDPGPDGDYPNLPRLEDGTLDTRYVPVGIHTQRGPNGRSVTVDLTPGIGDGRTILDVIAVAPGGCRCSAHPS